jgi:hypothetical protein
MKLSLVLPAFFFLSLTAEAASQSYNARCSDLEGGHHTVAHGTFSAPSTSSFQKVPAKKGLLAYFDTEQKVNCDFLGNYCSEKYDAYDVNSCYGLATKTPITVTLNGKTYRTQGEWYFSENGSGTWNDPSNRNVTPHLICPTHLASLKVVGNLAIGCNDTVPGMTVNNTNIVTAAEFAKSGLSAFRDENFLGVMMDLFSSDGSKLWVALIPGEQGNLELASISYEVSGSFGGTQPRLCEIE